MPAEDVLAAVGVPPPEADVTLLLPRPLRSIVATATEHQLVVTALSEGAAGTEDVAVCCGLVVGEER